LIDSPNKQEKYIEQAVATRWVATVLFDFVNDWMAELQPPCLGQRLTLGQSESEFTVAAYAAARQPSA